MSEQKRAIVKDISDLFRLSLCFLASIVVFAAGYITHRLNNYDTGIYQSFFEFLTENEVLPPEALLISFFIPFSLIAANHTINDYFDYEIDVANNRLDRPIVRGAISLANAKKIAVGLYSSVVLLSAILVFIYGLNVFLLVLVPFFIFLSVGYNLGVKELGLLGNAWVSIGYVFPFLIGPLIIGMDEFALVNILVICTFIFFLALGREILKDIMDIEGDIKAGMRSVAIAYGPHWAARLSALCFLITLFLGGLLMFMGFKNNEIFFLGMIALSVLLLYTGIAMMRNPDQETSIRGRKYTRWSLWLSTGIFFISSFFLP
ncbi:MAG: UbiA family prenyltransferase [Candidatus Hodarchaeota archaeon]